MLQPFLRPRRPGRQRTARRRRLAAEQLEVRRLLTGDLEVLPPFDKDFSHLDSPPDGGGALGPLSSFALHSRPGANHVVYLDFDGHVTNGTPWNNAYGANLVTPPFDLDGNPSEFSSAELQRINNIWERVAEDFAPFDVDITTEEPPLDRLIKSGPNDAQWGVRVAIGGDWRDWFGSPAGGVAYLRSFNWNTDTPTFVWPLALGRSEKNIAEATSHEVGHTLGLSHDGYSGGSYYSGHGDWAPIMGVGYSKPIVQWSRGEYATATTQQDDLNIIVTQNGFGYRPDDHGNDPESATETDLTFSIAGVIERNTDQDVFRLNTGEGTIQIDAAAYHRSPNLNIELTLLDADNNVVAVSSPDGDMSASLTVDVPAGEYFAVIDGVGEGDANTGFTNYGSLGQYVISGVLVDPGPAEIDAFTALDADREEGNVGDTPFTFLVSRSGNLGLTSTVDYAVTGTGIHPADAADFGGAFPSGRLQFDPGQETAVLTIPVRGDLLPEEDEEFLVTLSNPSANTNLLATTAGGVIRDGDLLVTNTLDGGAGSLRQAILDANAEPGSNTIAFDIADAEVPIQLVTPLPAITDPVLVLGTSQPGFDQAPLIRLDGSQLEPAAGLVVEANDSTITGLVIGGFAGAGIDLRGDNTLLAWNYIGNDGATPRPNQGLGVQATGTGVLIQDSVISGNLGGGVQAAGGAVLENNRIGVDAAGAAPLANGEFGVSLQGSGAVVRNNIISGNSGPGLLLVGEGHRIQDNRIGVGAAPQSVLSNDGDGVWLGDQAADVHVRDNVIAYNFGHGVQVSPGAASGNVVRGNSLLSNTGFGIELGAAGPEANDPLDEDTGPNGLQNSPLLTSAIVLPDTSELRVRGTLQSAPGGSYAVEFFLNDVLGTDGRGEGAVFLGETTVSTDAEGLGAFDVVLPAPAATAGQYVSATATSGEGTSEFSPSLTATNENLFPSVSIANAGRLEGDSGQGPMLFEVTLSNPTSLVVDVDYETSGGSAAASDDFAPRSGRLSFPPGVTRRQIAIDVFGDTEDEADENLFVTLTQSNNATLLRTQAEGVILDDDQDNPTRPAGAADADTSEFLLGEVDVHVLFLESAGDENLETWTPQDLARTRRNIEEGLQWWTEVYATLGLSAPLAIRPRFDLAGDPIAIDVEPTSLNSTDEALWIDGVLKRFSADTPAPAADDLARLTNVLRDEGGADWSVVLMVANNTGLKRRFADEVGSHGPLGGSHLTVLGDATPAEVAAALGRAFYALDESPAGDSSLLASGYLAAVNANGFVDHPDPASRTASIMAEPPLRDAAYAERISSASSLAALGWRDSDGDSIPDVLDQPLALSGEGFWNSTTGDYRFVGQSAAVPADNLNPFGLGNEITLNRVRALQYRVDGGDWITVASYDANAVELDETFGPVAPFDVLEVRTLDTETLAASASIVHNTRPTLDPMADVRIDEDAPEVSVDLLGVSAGDNEDQPLEVTATGDNPSLLGELTVDYASPDASGRIRFTPQPNQHGQAVVTVTVTDGGPDGLLETTADNASTSQSFTVVVDPVNDLPSVSTLDDATIDEDQPTPQLPFTVSDQESAPQQLTVSAVSDNPAVVRDADIVFTGLAEARTIQVAPVPNASGQAVITVTVADPAGGKTDTQFTVTVQPINDAPTISDIPNVTTAEDFSTALLSFDIADVETPARELTLTVSTSDEALLPVAGVQLGGDGSRRTVRVTPARNANGTGTVTLTILDADGASSSETFQVTVNPINDAPEISPLEDQTSDQDQTAGPYAFTVSDVDNEELQYTVDSSNQDLVTNDNIVIERSGEDWTIRVTPAPMAYGYTDITLTVVDAAGLSDRDTFRLTVNRVNQPPEISAIDDQSADEDNAAGPLAFTVQDDQSDAGDLVVAAASSDESIVAAAGLELTGTGENRSLTVRPRPDAFGDVVITLTVTDEGGLSREESFAISFLPVNDAPSLQSSGDPTLDEDGTAEVTWTLTDPDDLPADLQLSAVSNNPALIDASGLTWSGEAGSRVLTLTPLPDQFGQATITVTVADPSGAAETVTLNANVLPVNDAPRVVAELEDGEVLGFQRISLPVPTPLFEDVDDDELSWTLTTEDGQPVDWLTLAEDRVFGRPGNSEAGLQSLRIVAEDASGATAAAPLQINVLFNDFPWHNFRTSTDVNDDGGLTPQDAVQQLSYLVLNGSGELPLSGPNPNNLRLIDTTRDNRITPQDLAQVVAALYRQAGGEGEGEGEFDQGQPIAPSESSPASLAAEVRDEHLEESPEDTRLAPPRTVTAVLREWAVADREARLKDLALELADGWLD